MPPTDPSISLREEFNRWAEAGRGEGMEQDHLPITLRCWRRCGLRNGQRPGHRLRSGLAVAAAGEISARWPRGGDGYFGRNDPPRAARQRDFDNLMFVAGEVTQIPWQPNFFSHAISVESSYYWPDPAAGLKDIFRVLQDGGSAWT